MNVLPRLVKMRLDNSIKKLVAQKEKYVKHPNRDFIRNRKLSLSKLVELLITMGAGSQNKELLECYKFDVQTPTASAMIQQRNKLKPDALLYVLQEFAGSFKKIKKFKGHRLLAIDGSKIIIHRNPSDHETFAVYNKHSDGCNVLNLNALYDICNKLYLDALIQPFRKMNERIALIELIKRSPIKKKVILVADRGYESYNNIAHLEQKGWKYVIRVRASNIRHGILTKIEVPFNQEFDETISILMTRRQTKEIKSKPSLYRFLPKSSNFDFLLPGDKGTYPITFRVVCVKVEENNYQYLITNLNTEFSLEDLKYIYHKRWGIEISFRELKHTIAMLHFNSKKWSISNKKYMQK